MYKSSFDGEVIAQGTLQLGVSLEEAHFGGFNDPATLVWVGGVEGGVGEDVVESLGCRVNSVSWDFNCWLVWS